MLQEEVFKLKWIKKEGRQDNCLKMVNVWVRQRFQMDTLADITIKYKVEAKQTNMCDLNIKR